MSRNNYLKKYFYLNNIKEENESEEKHESHIEHMPEPLFKVRVIYPSLRCRSTPEIGENVVKTITDKGIYQIYDVRDGWGQLEDGNWIMLQYTKKISE